MKILFVCTGNTCRSPMAEGIFKETTKNLALQLQITSAGIMAYNGDSVSENAVIACKDYNADISAHTAKQITMDDALATDLFVCMTSSHSNALINAGIDESKIITLDVSDPYCGSIEIYKACCKEIYEKLLLLKEKLERLEK